MVDAFVSFAVQKLGDFLIQKVVLRLSIRDDVQWLINDLCFMQSFLKDAEEKQSEDQRVQQWMKETKFYKVGKEIQSLKQRIMDISRKRETYGIRNIDTIAGEVPSNRPNNGSALVRILRRTTSYVDEDHILLAFRML
ncbi:hypothetical protein RND71_015602 [Anisodus tanguticus]|uniref:Disease resistance N-terminal domain-containing protein n=1 Tax=Anisodus tanguticus TaxID=243964 RepID=A0AAE1S4K9_9SOLA|nr:hypothetical protein RND71_015602 [Anisodus tanguticus]